MATKKARVAIIGVGNCASSLVQGVQFYKKAADDARKKAEQEKKPSKTKENEQALAEAATRLKQAQAAYNAELQKAKGGQ